MKDLPLKERIEKGREAIARAKAQGKDVTAWEKHLADLERQLAEAEAEESRSEGKAKVRVKMGYFGFCTCLILIGQGLCSGCWRIKEACTCIEMGVSPEEEITRQYTELMRMINTPLRH